jgi:hypothetical protein
MNNFVCFELLQISHEEMEKISTYHELNYKIQEKIEKFKHGDILLLSSSNLEENMIQHYNETKFYLICERLINGNNAKCLCELIKISNSELCIPLEISKKLYVQNKKFIGNYLKLFQTHFKNYKLVFKAIELDFKIHLSLLPEEICLNNENEKFYQLVKLYYFFDKKESSENSCNFYFEILGSKNTCDQATMHMLTSNFQLIKFSDYLNQNDQSSSKNEFEIPFLSTSLESIHLGEGNPEIEEKDRDPEIEEKDRDPEIEEFAQKFKEIYDKDFKNYLKKLDRNEIIYATTLPNKKYCKETYEVDSLNSTTLMFYFERLDLDENQNINTVIVRTFDHSELCHFIPTLFNEYGLYYKTFLFTCLYNIGRKTHSLAENFFLDLPIHLYNKIESDN